MASSYHVIGSYAAGAGPWSVTAADLGNGLPDIVVGSTAGGVEVLMNQGGGSFAPAVSYATGSEVYSVTTADLGNGRQDIVAADYGSGVDVLMNQGGGSFAPATTLATGSRVYSVTTADLGNGHQDIIATDFNGGVDLLMNQGGGSFAPAVSYALPYGAVAVTTADLGNGSQDIIVANYNGSVDVLMNQGNGSFAAAVSFAVGGTSIRAITTADLGNGRQDIIVADQNTGVVDVLMNQGGGSFAPAVSYAVGGVAYSVTTADLGNGRQDIIVGDSGHGVAVLMNEGGGSFAPVANYGTGAIIGVTTADLNGPSHPDIVAADNAGQVEILGPGPGINPATYSAVEQGQTTVLGTVSPDQSGDTLSVAASGTIAGALSLGAVQADGTQQVLYTAPASIAASTTDTVSYVITDSDGTSTTSTPQTITLDAGPSVVAVTPSVVEKTQNTVIGTVTPGEIGDTLTLTQAAGGLGTVSLGAVQTNGTRQVIYTAPTAVTASGIDTVSYSVTDQHGGAVASQSASVSLDAGPSVIPIAAAVEHGQTAVIGIVTPGVSGDALTLAQAPGGLGTVSLGAVQTDGAQQVIYTAPASISTSGSDAVSYSITDQHNDVVTAQTTAVTLDAGAAIHTAPPGVIEQGQSAVLGTVTPGVAGDTLSVSQAPGALGAVTLGAVQADGTQQVIYTAPAAITATATDTVSYSIVDQHNLVVAADTASVGLDGGPSITPGTPAVVEGQSTVLGTVQPGMAGDTLSISGSQGMFGTVSLGTVQSDGSQQIIYTPPGDVQGSRVATFTYTITDQHNAASANQSASVTLDGGPIVSPQTPNVLEQGQTTVLATVAPGEPGDSLTLHQTNSAPGSIRLGAVQSDGTRQVIYTAPADIAATGNAAVSYELSDQHGAVQSAASANVALAVMAFTGLVVAAADTNATLSVSLTLDASSGGGFVDLGTGTLSTDGSTYSVSGTAAQVNAALHGLGFTSNTAGVTAPTFQASLSAGGAATLYGVSGADMITGTASGLALVGDSPGAMVSAPASGGDILVAGGGGEILDGSGAANGDVFFGAATGSIFKGGTGHDTFVGGAGNNTVTSGVGGSVVFLGSGANLVQSHGADTIVGSTGNDTIDAGAGGVVLFAGSGSTSFIGDAARSTVIGGAGALTVSGGAGGGAFYGSAAGNNVLQSGTGNAFLVGAGNGDQLIATGSASDILVAGQGNETLNASGSTGADLLYGGSGVDAITLGSGADTLLAGSGSAGVTVGSGSAMFDFVAGHGSTATITGFNTSKDHLALFGYGSGQAGHALQTAIVSGGNTTLALSDGSHITLLGVSNLGSASFV
ncbi:beta strand repeat-containing protein [Lichenicoccus sp.]|uniref:beta strand repeat-containing protein n=1 Tax=Lichenicoccus sp. TaxID=2781899 RepID=UPI003D0E98E0